MYVFGFVSKQTGNTISERSKDMKEKFKKFLFKEVASKPFVFAGIFLLQQQFEAWLAKWGGFAIRIGLALLFFYGIWTLTGMGRQMIGGLKERRKGGTLTSEEVSQIAKPDLLMMGLAVIFIAVPPALFLNWDTIQGGINRALGVATEF